MTSIAFGRGVCCELPAAERREWLVTNGLGGFASGTIAGTLTRRYHGVLIAAMHPPVDRRLLAAKIDERVTYDGTTYALSSNRWTNDYVDPRGFELIESFQLDGTTPVWQFAFADALLEKRVWMEDGADATYIGYRVLRASASVQLALRAFVNDRDFHANTHGVTAGFDVQAIDGGLAVALPSLSGGPPLRLHCTSGSWAIENVWYRDFVLAEETRRGLDDRDDHLAAGVLSATLRAGESMTVTVSRTAGAIRACAAGERERTVLDAWRKTGAAENAPAWMERCVLAADQFVVRRGDGRSVIAGYHWFGDWGRDTMISLPGLSLTTGRPDIAKELLLTFAPLVDGGMLPNDLPQPGATPEYNTIDAALWYVEAAAAYVGATGDTATLAALWPALQQVVERYVGGTRYGINMDADALLTGGAPGVQLTWMDAKVGDWVVTPRAGKPVEVNALWFNALARMEELARRHGVSGTHYGQLALAVRTGFERFWNVKTGYCYDVLDGPDGDDATLRPNQLFAIGLPHPVLAAQHHRAVVDVCAAQLLTPAGVRTLAPTDPNFAPRYQGGPRERDAAYHRGTAWPYLLGVFAVAHARAYRDAALAHSFLEPLTQQFSDAGLGTIGELADATAPFEPRGAIAQAWSVAELLRAWHAVPDAAAP